MSQMNFIKKLTTPKLLLLFLAYLALEIIGFYIVPGIFGYHGSLAIFAMNNAPYNASQAYVYLQDYGSRGQVAYAVSLVFDILFPYLYASLLARGLGFVAAKAGFSDRTQHLAKCFPFIAAFANWIADVGVLLMFLTYPTQISVVATIAGMLTAIKFSVIALSIAGILLGYVYVVIRKLFGRKA
jgi:hypothetical protein